MLEVFLVTLRPVVFLEGLYVVPSCRPAYGVFSYLQVSDSLFIFCGYIPVACVPVCPIRLAISYRLVLDFSPEIPTTVEVSMYVISNKPRFLGQINPTITISPSPDDRQWRIRSK